MKSPSPLLLLSTLCCSSLPLVYNEGMNKPKAFPIVRKPMCSDTLEKVALMLEEAARRQFKLYSTACDEGQNFSAAHFRTREEELTVQAKAVRAMKGTEL